ncbi:MAG: MFS transporter [Deltaproteobacteria bacterium]|nr:MFS transporter [Deltaproteobacteria bacterium]
MNGKNERFYYGWVIVGVSFLTLFASLGIRSSFGVFYVAILREYGWGRADTAGAFSLAMVIHGLFGLVTGSLIDRFGPRTLFPLGATLLAMGLAAASRITAIWHLYLFFGVFMAVGINTISYAPHMSRIPKWFVRKRGLASGLVLAGIGVGIMVMAPVSQVIIDAAGWRSAFLVFAGIVIGIVAPITALLQRGSPEEMGQFPDGIVPGSGRTHSPPSEGSTKHTRPFNLSEQWTLRTALRTRDYWWVVLVFFSTSFSFNMLVVHQAAHVVDAGYSPTQAALSVGLVGLLNSIGGVFSGLVSDRAGREIGCTLGASCAIVGVFLFLLVRDPALPWLLYAFVILFGLGFGATSPTIAATAGDLFSGNSLGLIMGTFATGWGFGGALGPYLGGYFYDQTGSYTIPLILAMVSFTVGILGIWMAAPRRRRPFI